MVFSSLIFIFKFLPIVLLAYYIVPRSLKNIVLLIASLIFYAWGEPIYIAIMIFAIFFDYTNSRLIDHYRDRKKVALSIFVISIVMNLAILSFFKYAGFLTDTINGVLNLHMMVPKLALPVGISFYTFESMSYMTDVYLKRVPVQKNIIAYGTYITFFPHLVAGPIVKYGDVAKQLENRKETLNSFGEGAELFIVGLGKKVLLGNNIGFLWHTIKAVPISELSIASAWIGIIAFTFQIYFDFSGYSDMALGLGKMFGLTLPQNFNYPYISKSVTEFWRRWHMSLGAWFREYLYIPLGGNRKGNLKQYRNLFIVWFLTGLWHGANWNFIIWGLYFGVFVSIEKVFLLKWLQKRPAWIAHVYTMLVVIIGWVFFEFEKLSQGITFIKTMFGLNTAVLFTNRDLYYLYTNFMLFILLVFCATPAPKKLAASVRDRLKMVGPVMVPILYMVLTVLVTAYLVNESYNPFLYFRF